MALEFIVAAIILLPLTIVGAGVVYGHVAEYFGWNMTDERDGEER